MPYVKLDCGILDSSLWVEPSDTRIVWITMLAMADADGFVEATAPGIARKACVPIEAARVALKTFESPDPDSRTEDADGRRAERLNGGYQILNYSKYRDKDYTNAARQARHRARRNGVTPVTPRVHGNGGNGVTSLPVTEAEAEALNINTVEVGFQLEPPEENASYQRQDVEINALTEKVFNYYIVCLGRDPVRTKLTAARRTMFKNRVREQWRDFSEPKWESAYEWSKEIVDKLAKDPYNNGQNQQGTKYIDWEHMFDSRKRVERWLNK